MVNLNNKITKSDIRKVYIRNLFGLQWGWNYEKMQGLGYAWVIMPALRKIYRDDPEGLQKALTMQLGYFNTTPAMSHLIIGADIALEEEFGNKAEDAVLGLKTGLMGPLAGIGDTISWSTLMYLFIGLFLPLAKKGNPLGGIGPIVLLTVICFGIGYFLTSKCYTFGYSFAENMLKSGLINMIITGASILGLFMDLQQHM